MLEIFGQIKVWGYVCSWCNWVTSVIINCVFILHLFLYSLPGLDQELPIPDHCEIWAALRPPWRSTETQRTHDVMITSLLCQNDVATSFWRNNDVIITSCQCPLGPVVETSQQRAGGQVWWHVEAETLPRTSVRWTDCVPGQPCSKPGLCRSCWAAVLTTNLVDAPRTVNFVNDLWDMYFKLQLSPGLLHDFVKGQWQWSCLYNLRNAD